MCKKRVIVFALSFCVSLSSIFAQKLQNYDYRNPRWNEKENYVKSEMWTYVRTGKSTCAIVNLDLKDYEKSVEGKKNIKLYIPSKLDELTVTEICNTTFTWSPCKGSMPYNLKEIHIPETVTFIEQGSFSNLYDGYMKVKLVVDGNNKAYEIIDNGLYSVKDRALICAFYVAGSRNMFDEDGYIPEANCFIAAEGTKIICSWAFNSLWEFKSILLPDSVILIEEDAFGYGLKEIIYVNIPPSVEKIKSRLLPANMEMNSGNPDLEYWEGGIYDRITKTLVAVQCDYSDHFVVKDGTVDTELIECDLFSKITYPESMKKIQFTSYFAEKNLPSQAEYINIKYPDGTLLPDTCRYYGGRNRIKVGKRNPYLKIENEMLLSKDGKTLYAIYEIPESGKLVIPSGVEKIERGTLSSIYNNKIQAIVLPDSLKEISAADFFYSEAENVFLNIPAKTRLYDYPGNHSYSFNVNVYVDSKNPVLVNRSGFLFDKKDSVLYYIKNESPQNEIIIPSQLDNLTSVRINPSGIETLIIVNPDTKMHDCFNKYADDESKDFNILVPKNSKTDKSLTASNVFHDTYVTYRTTDNLRLRNNPGTDSEIITTLKKDSVVRILKKEREEVTVEGITGHWAFVQVLSSAGEKNISETVLSENIKGWCFDGYLEIKKNSDK